MACMRVVTKCISEIKSNIHNIGAKAQLRDFSTFRSLPISVECYLIEKIYKCGTRLIINIFFISEAYVRVHMHTLHIDIQNQKSPCIVINNLFHGTISI